MAKESMNMNEGFAAQVIRPATSPQLKTRHYIIGWLVVATLLACAVLFVVGAFAAGDGVTLKEEVQMQVSKPLVQVTRGTPKPKVNQPVTPPASQRQRGAK